MKINEASWDRIVRVIIGVVLVYWGFFSGSLQGATGIIVGIIGLIPLITGIVGFCPLYTVFGFSTKK